MTTGRCWWGWGEDAQHLDRTALDGLGRQLSERFGVAVGRADEPVAIADLQLAPPRLSPPDALRHLVATTAEQRARYAHGNAYRDVVRAFRGELPTVPDAVAHPTDDGEVAAILDWCDAAGAACVPFGGGTSVVGGVNPPDRPTVTLALDRTSGLLDLDAVSGAARFGAGTAGPEVEDALRPHGLTLRFFPQSWEFSTVGGWVATRAAGHFATGPTHIDDLVEAAAAITPTGEWRSLRVPASGAGPSPDRLLLGSEGILGVITDAWLRVRPRPVHRADAVAHFDDVRGGCRAVRAIVQAELRPAGCRLLDATEAALVGAGDGTHAVLLLGFESADHPLHPWVDRALELVRDQGGVHDEPRHRSDGAREAGPGAAGAWRRSFLAAPYLRDALVALGMVVETFESAVTWDRLDGFLDGVLTATRDAAVEVCGAAEVTVRFTHAYPDGVAPYVTVIAPGRRGAEVQQWDEIKSAAAEAVLAAGGTITHHHAVGRDHLPWYERQRPAPFAAALRGAKAAVDPAGIMNPGVLLR